MSSAGSPFLSMGHKSHRISLKDVFCANRRKICQALKNEGHRDGCLVLIGGKSETRYDSDHEPLFRQESYFWYLTGVKEPDCAILLDIATQEASLYIPKLPAEYATIMGKIESPDEWKERYQVDGVRYTEELEYDCLRHLKDSSNGSRASLYLMEGPNSDSGNMYMSPKELANHDELKEYVDSKTLFPLLAECRVIKSEAELQILQFVTEITSFAHAYVMRNFKPGMHEYQGESLFRHYCYFNYGCRLVGYTPICGCGPNSAVLHYGHAGEPNARESVVADTALFDMGAEYFGYGSDVTCSFPVSGSFSDKQRPIYNTVLKAQVAVYNKIKPGVSWLECHKAAELAILVGLASIGLVLPGSKTFEELVDMRLGAVFMPHGLGHFIGIDTHDVGGYLEGHQNRVDQPGLRSLRTARILQKNMVLTVEPGCYFIDHLLNQALADGSPFQEHLDEQKVREYRGFGGVRLEDVVAVTESGFINYTLCPRTSEEVESVMQGSKWPPRNDTAPELGRTRLTDPTPMPSPPSY